MQKLGGRGGKRSGLEAFGESINLVGVENGIAFEEGDFAFDVFAFFVGLGLGETVGIDNEGTGFTFANLAAKFLGLLVGHPEGRGKTFVGSRTPKQKNVHAFVGGSVVGVTGLLFSVGNVLIFELLGIASFIVGFCVLIVEFLIVRCLLIGVFGFNSRTFVEVEGVGIFWVGISF